ncbi:MAG TPA: hypothetical protein V6D34_01110, partial [Candidatus Sericytochromatia bacterium]
GSHRAIIGLLLHRIQAQLTIIQTPSTAAANELENLSRAKKSSNTAIVFTKLNNQKTLVIKRGITLQKRDKDCTLTI